MVRARETSPGKAAVRSSYQTSGDWEWQAGMCQGKEGGPPLFGPPGLEVSMLVNGKAFPAKMKR